MRPDANERRSAGFSNRDGRMDALHGWQRSVAHGFRAFRLFSEFLGTVRAVILAPAAFFGDLYRQRSSGSAVLFGVICAVINLLLLYAVAPVDSWIWGETNPPADRFYWIVLALSPLFAWIGLYLIAAVQHLFVTVFVRPRKRFDATLRVSAYASAVALLS